jgi:hypothetical protein
MEVIAAVVVGALLWLLGRGRRPKKNAKTPESLARPAQPIRRVRGPAVSRDPRAPRPAAPLAARSGTAHTSLAAIIPTPTVYAPGAVHAHTKPLPPLRTAPLVHVPITLGVALMLQAAAFTLLCMLGALGYIGLEIKGHDDAQAVQRSLTREISQLEASLLGTRRTLDSIQRSLDAQTRDHAASVDAPSKLTSQAKAARVRQTNKRQ